MVVGTKKTILVQETQTSKHSDVNEVFSLTGNTHSDSRSTPQGLFKIKMNALFVWKTGATCDAIRLFSNNLLTENVLRRWK